MARNTTEGVSLAKVVDITTKIRAREDKMSAAKKAKTDKPQGRGEFKPRAVRWWDDTNQRLADYVEIRGLANYDEAINRLLDLDPITEEDVLNRFQHTISRGTFAQRKKQ